MTLDDRDSCRSHPDPRARYSQRSSSLWGGGFPASSRRAKLATAAFNSSGRGLRSSTAAVSRLMRTSAWHAPTPNAATGTARRENRSRSERPSTAATAWIRTAASTTRQPRWELDRISNVSLSADSTAKNKIRGTAPTRTTGFPASAVVTNPSMCPADRRDYAPIWVPEFVTEETAAVRRWPVLPGIARSGC